MLDHGSGEDAVQIPATLPILSCTNPDCDLETTDEEGERLESEAICAFFNVLNAREIKAIRIRHGLTRAGFSGLTGIDESTLGRWERGVLTQNRAIDNYLRLLREPEIFDVLMGQQRSQTRRTEKCE